MAAGTAKDYFAASDKVIAATKLVGGGESDSFTVKVAKLKGDGIMFFCTFPGHVAMMNGTVTVAK